MAGEQWRSEKLSREEVGLELVVSRSSTRAPRSGCERGARPRERARSRRRAERLELPLEGAAHREGAVEVVTRLDVNSSHARLSPAA